LLDKAAGEIDSDEIEKLDKNVDTDQEVA